MKEFVEAFLGIICIATPVVLIAKPIGAVSSGNVSITLYDDKCDLKIQLPYKATWLEGRKEFQGCWGMQSGVVVLYFDDNSIAVLPTNAFRPATVL